MPSEPRTRITIALPAPSADDLTRILVLDTVLTELKQICGRVISTPYQATPFDIRWVKRRPWEDMKTKIVLIIADAPIPTNDVGLIEYLEDRQAQWESDFGRRVHITVHGVYRINNP
jgi:hypothetical protein